MVMRISGGELKGRRISRKGLKVISPHGGLRATSAKVRESIFNILGGRVKDAVFVDLYSGTGAVGFEAMSRGGRTVYFVEADRKRTAVIEDLIKDCGCRQRAVVATSEAADFIRRSEAEGRVFDIIFLDPPYGTGEDESTLSLLGGSPVLEVDALVLAEHPSRKALQDEFGSLRKTKTYRYGDTSLTLYRKEGA